MSETPADASRAIVLACIKQLTDEHGSATYQQIIDAAGISPHIVKERCDQLVNVTHEVERITRGVYRAIKSFAPPRPISKTVLADGEVVLEIGDDVVHLTPQEERLLRGMFGSAPVEIHQPPPQVQAAQPIEQSPVMQITEIACLYRVPVRFARKHIVTAQGFPSPIPGSSQRKKLWPRHAVERHAQSAHVH
mgnify:CR=1 FL=1